MAKGISVHVGVKSVDLERYKPWAPEDSDAPENDARAMKEIAQAQGFAATLLIAPEATAAAVKKEVSAAAKSIQSGDLFLLTFAGHGSEVPDKNGDWGEENDQTWCLHDRQFLDDEVRALLTRFRQGARILLVSDSCHSGTMHTLAPGGLRHRSIPTAVRRRVYRNHSLLYRGIQGKLPTKPRALRAQLRTLSACLDNEVAYENATATYGIFTEQLMKVWNQGGFQGTYGTFLQAIKQKMPTDPNNRQTPNASRDGPKESDFGSQRPFTI